MKLFRKPFSHASFGLLNGAVEMLRQAQQDNYFYYCDFLNSFNFYSEQRSN